MRSSRTDAKAAMKLPEVTGKINMGTALIAATLAIMGTLSGISWTYGQFARQISINERDIQEMKKATATKDDVNDLKNNIQRLDNNVQKLTDHLIENKSATRKSRSNR